jgi:predicted component of type VI protein secretion system
MDVKLVVTGGSTKAQVIQLHSAETIIGRQRGCDIRIPSARVSRRHCRLIFRDNGLTVVDLVSSNGTYLNNVAVEGQELVRPGDQLSVGPVTFRVEYQLTINAMLWTQPAAPTALGDMAEVIKLVEEEPSPIQKVTVPAQGGPSPVEVIKLVEEEPPPSLTEKVPAQSGPSTIEVIKLVEEEPAPRQETKAPAQSRPSPVEVIKLVEQDPAPRQKEEVPAQSEPSAFEVIKLLEEEPAPSQEIKLPAQSGPSPAVKEAVAEDDEAAVKFADLAWIPPNPEDIRDILSKLEDE